MDRITTIRNGNVPSPGSNKDTYEKATKARNRRNKGVIEITDKPYAPRRGQSATPSPASGVGQAPKDLNSPSKIHEATFKAFNAYKEHSGKTPGTNPPPVAQSLPDFPGHPELPGRIHTAGPLQRPSAFDDPTPIPLQPYPFAASQPGYSGPPQFHSFAPPSYPSYPSPQSFPHQPMGQVPYGYPAPPQFHSFAPQSYPSPMFVQSYPQPPTASCSYFAVQLDPWQRPISEGEFELLNWCDITQNSDGDFFCYTYRAEAAVELSRLLARYQIVDAYGNDKLVTEQSCEFTSPQVIGEKLNGRSSIPTYGITLTVADSHKFEQLLVKGLRDNPSMRRSEPFVGDDRFPSLVRIFGTLTLSNGNVVYSCFSRRETDRLSYILAQNGIIEQNGKPKAVIQNQKDRMTFGIILTPEQSQMFNRLLSNLRIPLPATSPVAWPN